VAEAGAPPDPTERPDAQNNPDEVNSAAKFNTSLRPSSMRSVRIEAERPEGEPPGCELWLQKIRQIVNEKGLAEQTPFLKTLEKLLTVNWSESGDDRLGYTLFEMSIADVERRKKMSMPPGPVTVFLHPVLITDTNLLNHTYVHELLHAAGLTAHDPLHKELLLELAPMPKLSESPLLQRLRGAVLAEQEITSWNCENCEYSWSRTTVRPPLRCPKCARRLR